MAEHVLDGSPPPAPLRRAWSYQAWHVDVFRLPPGELPQVNAALNAYNALKSYRQAAKATKTKEWTEANPDAWEFVSSILAERMRRQRAQYE